MNSIAQDASRNATRRGSKPVIAFACGRSCLRPGRTALLDNIFLQIAEGISMILGSNGAGKSILMRILHGLIPASAGTVSWRGRAADRKIRTRQAMVFQQPVLLRRSAAANIDHALRAASIPGAERIQRTMVALEEAGIAHLAARPARILSGGEQQRLALARALSLRPDVLFLDEPTARLDPASTAAIEALVLAAEARGCKIIMISHDIHQARRLASEIIFMDRGKITEQGAASAPFQGTASSAAARDYLAGRLHLPDSA